MAVTRVELKDLLVFKGDFAADFCPGVNVLLGNLLEKASADLFQAVVADAVAVQDDV